MVQAIFCLISSYVLASLSDSSATSPTINTIFKSMGIKSITVSIV